MALVSASPSVSSCLFDVWLVSWFGSTITQETTLWISKKLGSRMCGSPEQTPLTFGVDLDKWIDPGNLCYFFFLSVNNSWILICLKKKCIFRWLVSVVWVSTKMDCWTLVEVCALLSATLVCIWHVFCLLTPILSKIYKTFPHCWFILWLLVTLTLFEVTWWHRCAVGISK